MYFDVGTRQKLRIKLAEAVLFNMPHLQPVIAAGQKRKKLEHLLPSMVENQDDEDIAPSASVGPVATEPGSHHDTQHPAPASARSCAAGNGTTDERSAQANAPLSMASTPPHHLDLTDMHFDFGAGSGIDLGVDGSGSDRAFTHPDWINVDFPSPSEMLLSTMPTSPTQNPSVGSIVVATAAPKQDGLPLTDSVVPPPFDAGSPWRSERRGLHQRASQQSSPALSFTSPTSTEPSPTTASSSTTATTCTGRYSSFSCSRPPGSLPGPAPTADLIHPALRQNRAAASCITVAGAAPPAKDIFEATSPVFTALSLGNFEMARLLVRSGAKINVPDANGRTALHSAVDRGDVSLAHALLDLGADVLTADKSGMRFLHTAIENDDREMVRLVLGWCQAQSQGSNDTTQAKGLAQGTGRNLNPERNPERGSKLLQRFINAQDGRKLTGVHLCVVLQRVEILKILLKFGADVNIGCN